MIDQSELLIDKLDDWIKEMIELIDLFKKIDWELEKVIVELTGLTNQLTELIDQLEKVDWELLRVSVSQEFRHVLQEIWHDFAFNLNFDFKKHAHLLEMK